MEGMKYFMGMMPPQSFSNKKCHIIHAFGNVGVIETSDGLVIFDLALIQMAKRNFRSLRELTDKQVKYIIYSHGHFDHCFGFIPIVKEIKEKGWDMPEVIAHENCLKRFEKYRMLDGYHNWLNAQQFASVSPNARREIVSAHETLDPTIVLKGEDSYEFSLGDTKFEVYHDIGETDDSLWLYVPDHKLICSGDLMISSYPNIGNPYKVQRYPKGWALAMEHMLEKEADYLIPGHGKLIEGKDNVKDVLSITRDAMHFVHDEVVKRMNEGKWFEEIFHEMLEIYPERFKNHDYLRPVYGCYQFAIHAVYRLYHGWYNTGNPTNLFPAKKEDIAKEFLQVAPAEAYLNHAKTLQNQQKYQLALHCVDVAINGIESQSNEILEEAYKLKKNVLNQLVKEESSFIASNIYGNEISHIKKILKQLKE